MPDNMTPLLAPDVIAQQQKIQQQQAMAQALMQRGMQDQGQTQSIGGVAIRNSPVSGLANMLSAYTGGRMMDQGNKDTSALNDRRRQMLAESLNTGLKNYQQDPMGSISTLGQNPDTAPYAQELLRAQFGHRSDYGLTPVYLQNKTNPNDVIMAQPSQGGGFLSNGQKIDESKYVPVLPTSVMNLGNRQVMVNRAGQQVSSGAVGVNPTNVYDQNQQNQRQANEPNISGQKDAVKANVDRAQANIDKANTLKLWEKAKEGLVSGLAGSETGPVAGRIPAVTSAQQVAEGAVSAMAPVLKQLFRVSGEGTFTDKDQELLLKMLPTRTDSKTAAAVKLQNIDNLVNAKLAPTASQGAPAQPAAPAGMPAATPKRLIFNPATGQLE